jgi:hypothetical protein
MTSKRKVETNRRNALKSTGPKSPAGKARVSRNAVTHGLCSRKALLPHENLRAMRAQLKALRRDLKPQGAREESLVALMARDLRKLARHDRLEVGVLRYFHSGILAKRARRKAHIYGDKLEVSSRPRDRKNYDRARAKAKRMRARRKASLPTLGLAFIRGSQGGDAFSKLARYNGATERSYLRKLEALQRLRQARLGGRRPPPSGSNISASGGIEDEPDNPGGTL